MRSIRHILCGLLKIPVFTLAIAQIVLCQNAESYPYDNEKIDISYRGNYGDSYDQTIICKINHECHEIIRLYVEGKENNYLINFKFIGGYLSVEFSNEWCGNTECPPALIPDSNGPLMIPLGHDGVGKAEVEVQLRPPGNHKNYVHHGINDLVIRRIIYNIGIISVIVSHI